MPLVGFPSDALQLCTLSVPCLLLAEIELQVRCEGLFVMSRMGKQGMKGLGLCR